MKIAIETHCHTIACQHAYSTVAENARYAYQIGLKAIAITDHGPELPDGAHPWHFGNQRCLPLTIEGVRVLKGAEVNIMNEAGDVDLEDFYLKHLDLVIASMHEPVYPPADSAKNTEAWLNIAKNPYIDIIGHSGSDHFKFDYRRVIPEFKRYNKAVELNNHSFAARGGSEVNCLEIARTCKENGVNVVVSSDAHVCYGIGDYGQVYQMLDELAFPEELVLNADPDRFFSWLSEKRGRRINLNE